MTMKDKPVKIDLDAFTEDTVLAKAQERESNKEALDASESVLPKVEFHATSTLSVLFALVGLGYVCAGLLYLGVGVNTWFALNILSIVLGSYCYHGFSKSLNQSDKTPFVLGYYGRYFGVFSICAWVASMRILDQIVLDPKAVEFMLKLFPTWNYAAWSAATFDFFESPFVTSPVTSFMLSTWGAVYFRSYLLVMLSLFLFGHAIDQVFLSANMPSAFLIQLTDPLLSVLVYGVCALCFMQAQNWSSVKTEWTRSNLLVRYEDLLWWALAVCFVFMHASFWILSTKTYYDAYANTGVSGAYLTLAMGANQLLWFVYNLHACMWSYKHNYLQYFRLNYMFIPVNFLVISEFDLGLSPAVYFLSSGVIIAVLGVLYWRYERELMQGLSQSKEPRQYAFSSYLHKLGL